MSFVSEFLSLLGLASAEDHRAAEAHATELSDKLMHSDNIVAALKRQLQATENALSGSRKECSHLNEKANRMRALQNWCCPRLMEFPPGTPKAIHSNTLRYLRAILGSEASLFDLGNPAKFSSPAQLSLYWCLAHASNAAAMAAAAAKNEDGISRAFLDELESQAKKASSITNEAGKLQIAYNAIFEQNEPAMKEAAVGADILLIIAGSSFVPNGLARIFWIQAKKAGAGVSPFNLRYDQRNTQGLQVEALSKVNEPDRGSFGLYMQYSNELAYVPAVSVSNLSWADGKCVADMSAIGVRLSEFLVTYTCAIKDVGAFVDTNDLRAYLDEVSEMKPLYVVTATAEGLEYRQELSHNHLLSNISDYYRQKLGLTRTRERERDRSYGLER